MTTEPADYYRVGNHQPQNIYRGDTYIGVMFDPAYAAAVVDALNTAEWNAPPVRPWCGAPEDLGGQQPCPIKAPCPADTCRIGQAVGSETCAPAAVVGSSCPACGSPNPSSRKGRWDGGTATFCANPWHDPAPDQCPNCTSGRRDFRFVVPVMDGTAYIADEVCRDGWHDQGKPAICPRCTTERGDRRYVVFAGDATTSAVYCDNDWHNPAQCGTAGPDGLRCERAPNHGPWDVAGGDHGAHDQTGERLVTW